MVRKSRKLLFNTISGLSLMLLVLAHAHAAEVTAHVDRTEIVEGETITLELRTDDPQQSLTSDLNGLQENFAILDQRTETQMSIVNGQQSAVVRLMAFTSHVFIPVTSVFVAVMMKLRP